MNRGVLVSLLLALLLTQTDATLQRLLRRQSEQESTTAASSSSNTNQGQQQQNGNNNQQPARLYPDLPRQQPFLAPTFPAGPTPFVPFGLQPPGQPPFNGRLMQQPRPMSAEERAQSETFTNGLGRRLLSRVGIEWPTESRSSNETSADGSTPSLPAPNDGVLMKALANSTVLQQLNNGLQSFYGGLSKMYNTTVQQQLDMLRDRFQREAGNTTNPWQQRMAQQVPQFFQRMALKVNEAQQNLNQAWSQMIQARNQNGSTLPEPQTRAGPELVGGSGQFFGNNGGPDFFGPQMGSNGNFFDQLGRSFGFGPARPAQDGQQPRDLGSQLMDFWHNQLQPQMGMIRSQMARVWRELTQSGALANEPMVRSRNAPGSMNQPPSANAGDQGAPSELVDSILKEVDANSPEYKLVDPVDSGDSQQPPALFKNNMGTQMQTRLVTMQKELNHLWNGLTNSLQNALGNVRRSLNPQPQFGPANFIGGDNGGSNSNNKEAPDQSESEISAKIKDLNKAQKDADVVYDIVQQQQQQRPTFVDRFRNFMGSMNLENVDQLSNRFGEQVSRFGHAVGDFWNQIPNRWDNFVLNVRATQQDPNSRLMAPTPSPAPEKPEMVQGNK